MRFNIDDKVTTPNGTGYVVYAEDVYIEVEINGNDAGFHAPFEDVSPYVDETVIKAEKVADNEAVAKNAFRNLPEGMVQIGKSSWAMSKIAILTLGGAAEDWDKLTYMQRMNFISVAGGTSTKILLDKYGEKP